MDIGPYAPVIGAFGFTLSVMSGKRWSIIASGVVFALICGLWLWVFL